MKFYKFSIWLSWYFLLKLCAPINGDTGKPELKNSDNLKTTLQNSQSFSSKNDSKLKIDSLTRNSFLPTILLQFYMKLVQLKISPVCRKQQMIKQD